MKKVLFISLLLVAVFLIGSAGVASAQCNFQQDYTCKLHAYQNGKVGATISDCVTLCYEDFAVAINDPAGLDFFKGMLYPALDYEDLLGTFNSTGGMGGCSVEFPSRRSIRVNLTFIGGGIGVVNVLNCTACDGCCH